MTPGDRLRDEFLQVAGELPEGTDAGSLAALLAAVAERWPTLHLDGAQVVRELAATWSRRPAPRGPLPAHVGDVVLAQACLRGDAEALRIFEREMFVRAERVLGRLRLAASDMDDVRQEVRSRLLVGGEARLARYEGSGALTHWVASVTGREALQLLRRRRRPIEPLEEYDGLLVDDRGDPELATLNARHGHLFKAAFQAAVALLTPRERTLLRALVVDGYSVVDLAALYKVHRATASRWVSDIRARLLAETRKALHEKFSLDEAELDSAVRLISNGLDMSLQRLLLEGSR
jgi:RNA polymerase sigma-70 factor (ECF subfamily)